MSYTFTLLSPILKILLHSKSWPRLIFQKCSQEKIKDMLFILLTTTNNVIYAVKVLHHYVFVNMYKIY